ncbi:uncharacterized protein LOC110860138 [Folsomia candida]|uniref:Uncharacterized protein n=1 Tax=Folsomia candida TaxID=158441 RepID=A0A226D9R6_FOLCA|nr:uncharacterized protein LOC110860138 [Folsomia candida]OXA41594.1 hypothetical protein Fcan01_23641 [Folsomia candida]
MKTIISILSVTFILRDHLSSSTFVNPDVFLNSRLTKGLWVSGKDSHFSHGLLEGGWVWGRSGKLQVTHVCRAKSGGSLDDVSITPGELVNGTCYISRNPKWATGTGVSAFKEGYEVLLKAGDVDFDWVEFDKDEGTVAHGALTGGIGSHYEPVLVCRKYFNNTGGIVPKTMAVLGNFSPKEGKCFYEMEVRADFLKWDVSFATEKFELLVLKPRGKQQCADESSSKRSKSS